MAQASTAVPRRDEAAESSRRAGRVTLQACPCSWCWAHDLGLTILGSCVLADALWPTHPGSCHACSCADRPQFHRQVREFTRLMNRDAARALQCAPQIAAAIELEIRKAGVIRNLSGRDRHRLERDAR